MASLHNFMRWLKDKTGSKSHKSHKGRAARSGNLPPIPPPRYEYGFRIEPNESTRPESPSATHIYEEISDDGKPETNCHDDSDDAMTSSSEPDNIVEAMQKLDFGNAKTVGPYLVVPIRKSFDENSRSNSATMDLIAGLRQDAEPTKIARDDYRSLYSMLPEWAKHQLKNSACKRQGLAISRGYSVDAPPSYQHGSRAGHHVQKQRHGNAIRNVCNKNSRHAEQSACVFDSSLDSGHGCDETKTNRRNLTGHQRRRHSVPCSNDSSEYDVLDQDDDENNYEYFLVKTENNLRLEQELKNYLTETDDSMLTSSVDSSSLTNASCIVDDFISESSFGNAMSDETEGVLLVQRRDTARTLNVCQRQSHSHNYNDDRFRVEAESLFDKLYQSAMSIGPSHRPEHDNESIPNMDRRILDTEQDLGRKHANTKLNVRCCKVDKSKRHTMNTEICETNTDAHMSKCQPREDAAFRKIRSSMASLPQRRSCRMVDVAPDKAQNQHGPSIEYKLPKTSYQPKSCRSSSSSSGIESDADGSIYGPARAGGKDGQNNRFLGDMMRMNHDRQLMNAW